MVVAPHGFALGPCNSQVTKEAEAEGIQRVTKLLGSRQSIASVKGLPTRAKIDPTLYGVEAGDSNYDACLFDAL